MDYTKICINCMHIKNDPYEICPNCGFDPAGYRWSPYALAPFTVLNGRYLVGRVLGTGGFGITYMVFDMVLERTRAVKELFVNGSMYRDSEKTPEVTAVNNGTDSLQTFEANLERFVQEARILAKLEELPGIVRVYDCFQENGTAYIVMEYLEGTTLKQYQQEKGGKLSYAEALEKFRPVIKSLEYLHKNGIIHRDISPDNLMVRKDGTLTLFDFGGAGIKGEELRSFTAIKNGFTPVEQQYAEGNQGAWTDEYAMAATIYYSITGIIPPESVERAIRINNDPLQKPSSLLAELPGYVEDALMKGLSVQKEDRFPDMEAFEKALYNAESATGGDKAGGSVARGDKAGGSAARGDKAWGSAAGGDKTGGSAARENKVGDANGGGGNKHRIPIIAAIASLALIVAVLFALNQRGTPEDGGNQKPANESEQLQASAGGAGVLRSGDKVADDSKKSAEEPEMLSPTAAPKKAATNTPAPKPTKTNTPSPKPTATKTPTPKPTATNTPTPKPTATNTPTPKPTATNTPTPKPTATNTPTPKPTATNTPTPKPTATNTPTPKPTATNTPTPIPTPTSTPKPIPTRASNWENHFILNSDVRVGAVVLFGEYYSEPDVTEPIEWYVIDKDGDKVLLVSKYFLDVVGDHGSNHWVNSRIRSWLNYSFIDKAFTASEKSRICMSTVKNDEDIGDGWQGVKDSETEDRIFLLTYKDIHFSEYPNDSAPTEYAISKGAYLAENGTGAIHTRSFYTGAKGEGWIYMYWDDADPGENGLAIQPAMWVYTGPSFYTEDRVRKAQEKLNDKGYNCGTADGIIGANTARALKEFQKDNHLTITGTLTGETKSKLGI